MQTAFLMSVTALLACLSNQPWTKQKMRDFLCLKRYVQRVTGCNADEAERDLAKLARNQHGSWGI